MIILDKTQETWTIYIPNPYSDKLDLLDFSLQNLETLKKYSPNCRDLDPTNPYFYEIELDSVGYKPGEYEYTLHEITGLNETPKYVSSGIIKIL